MSLPLLDGEYRSRLIEGALSHVEANYVLPDLAVAIAADVRSRLGAGEYDGLTDAEAFCARVTEQMQAAGGDRHLRLRPKHRERSPLSFANPEEYRQHSALQNYGFNRVERLPGNVGYLDLRAFQPPEWAGDTAVAAMNLLSNSSALIVDLRQCPGGSPHMVQLLTSYLFDESVHLNSFENRSQNLFMQFWTHAWVPGRRLGKVPVYVLTSKYTFSAAEEFTYNLKQMNRATVVGETTGGGANPGRPYALDEHFEIFVPGGRAVNPISGTNWEGVGVEPDVAVPKEQALVTAHREALKQLLAEPPSERLAAEVRQALAELGE